MEVPKIAHFNVAIWCTLICGVWPMVSTKNALSKKAYGVYSWILFLIAGLYILSHCISLFLCITEDCDVKILTKNYIGAIILTLGMIRVHSIWTETCLQLIREVMAKEKQIYDSKDERIIDIYNRNVKKNRNTNYCYWIFQFVDTAIYTCIVYPIFVPKETYIHPITNETFIQTPLIVNIWFPFDVHKHHLTAFLWEEIAITVGILISYGTDVFYHGCMAYILGQFDIIKHILNHFEDYKDKVQNLLNCEDDKADFVTMQLTIIEHQRILRFITQLNEVTKNIMLLDFLQGSVQIAFGTVFFMNESNPVIVTVGCAFIMLIVSRLGVYYWYASEITEASYSLAKDAYGIKWYEKSQKLKKLLIILIMRCNKEIGLEIGGLTIMSWNVFLGIVKGAYSYLTFALQK